MERRPWVRLTAHEDDMRILITKNSIVETRAKIPTNHPRIREGSDLVDDIHTLGVNNFEPVISHQPLDLDLVEGAVLKKIQILEKSL